MRVCECVCISVRLTASEHNACQHVTGGAQTRNQKHRRRTKDCDLSRNDDAVTLCTSAPAGTDAAGPQAHRWRRLRTARVLERKRENNVHPGSHSFLPNHQRQLFGNMIPAPKAVRGQAAVFGLEQRGVSSRQIELSAWIKGAGEIRYGNQGSVLIQSQTYKRQGLDSTTHHTQCMASSNSKQGARRGGERRM